MTKNKLKKIIDNNIILKNLYNNKNVCNKEIESFIKKLENIKIIHENFTGKIPKPEILFLHYLIENDFKFHNNNEIDISKVKIKKNFELNANNNNLNIGDIVEISDNIKNEKFLGIYLGEYPSNYNIYCSDNELVIDFNEMQYMFYSPTKNKLYSSQEIFYKRLDKKKQEHIKKRLEELFKL